MDYREQDGTQDYWDGGYLSESDPNAWYNTLSGAVDWSGQSEPLYFEIVYVHESEGPGDDEISVMVLTGHIDDYYNGAYFQAEDWNGHPHYATEDRRAHLFYLEWADDGFWQLDWREQDGTEDLYDGGYTYAEPHVEEIAGDLEWTVEDADYYETYFDVTWSYEHWNITEAPDCWGGDYVMWEACMNPAEDDMAWGEYYYDWDSDWYYGDWYYGDWYYDDWYYGGEDWFYYSGDNWSVYGEMNEDGTALKARFEDFFYWAIIGDSDGSGDCMATCGQLETMCCAGVSLKQGDTNLNQAHCMNQQVVEENARTTLGDMDVELVCKGDSGRGDGARFLGVGASILSLIAAAMLF